MKYVLALILCLSLAACGQSGKPRIVKEDSPAKVEMGKDYYSDYSHPRVAIHYGSKNIYKWIDIVNPRMGSAGNLAKFAITIRNNTQNTLPVEYQITWLDREYFPLPVSTAAWNRFDLAENADKQIVSVAKMPEAYYVQIELRGAKDIKILVPLPLDEDGRIDYPNLYR